MLFRSQAENIKRLIAVNITPEDNLVQITGKNEQGKSSVLDSIWWALEGAKNIQVEPIHKGATTGRIRLELGDKEVELIVTRTFKKSKDGGFTTKLSVTTPDGIDVAGGAQTVLNGFLDALTFDPLTFSRMKPPEQFETLKKFVPGVDFEAVETANKKDYEGRREVNRELKIAQASVEGIETTATEETVIIDTSMLIDRMQTAGEENASIEIRKNNRRNYQIKVAENRDNAKKLIEEADEIQKKLDNAGELPEPIDISEVREKLEIAKSNNDELIKFNQRKDLLDTVQRLEEEADNITTRMKLREEDKRKAIAEAKIPVDNIDFGDGIVLLKGVPFEQGSQAERIRASMAIAMASNPKLRVILMREGSLLDEDSEQIVREMAVANNFDVWQEKVDSSGQIGFVIEDGKNKPTEEIRKGF